MKKKFLSSLAACAVCMTAVLLLTGMTEAMEETKKSQAIGELVMKRADAMNGYFAGEVEYSMASELLHDIESGDLLKEDLFNLESYANTDIDRIEYCRVTEVLIRSEDEFCVEADVTVEWLTSGLDGIEVMDVTYSAVCEKHGKALKLVQFFYKKVV